MKAAVLAVVLFSSGCCWMSRRSCFPPCEPPPPVQVVKIEKPCELPPLDLPGFKQADEGCPAEMVCFDRDNAAQLYVRLARLKDFAKMARTRCAKPPSSQPVR